MRILDCKYKPYFADKQINHKLFFQRRFGTVLGNPPLRQKEQPMVRILIYSEDGLLAALIATILAERGIELCVARNLTTLDRLIERGSYEVVIVVGVGLLRRGGEWLMRLRPRRLHLPRIYLVAWQHSEQTVLGMLECGIDQYMALPLNPGRLRAKVMQVLAR